MDLNELLARHQIALIDADHARTATVREAAAALEHRKRLLRAEHRATGAVAPRDGELPDAFDGIGLARGARRCVHHQGQQGQRGSEARCGSVRHGRLSARGR